VTRSAKEIFSTSSFLEPPKFSAFHNSFSTSTSPVKKKPDKGKDNGTTLSPTKEPPSELRTSQTANGRDSPRSNSFPPNNFSSPSRGDHSPALVDPTFTSGTGVSRAPTPELPSWEVDWRQEVRAVCPFCPFFVLFFYCQASCNPIWSCSAGLLSRSIQGIGAHLTKAVNLPPGRMSRTDGRIPQIMCSGSWRIQHS
jgi:hypothetical protein